MVKSIEEKQSKESIKILEKYFRERETMDDI
jgi:hypothetical protein